MLEELLLDDLVGVDVGPVQRADHASTRVKVPGSPAPRRRRTSGCRPRCPAIAAAAAIGVDEVGAPALALAALLEVPVRRAPLTGLEDVVVHGEAHRAAGVAPLEARLAEDAVEASASASAFTPIEPGTTMARIPVGDAAPAHDLGGGAQVGEGAVLRIGADEDGVEGDVLDRLPPFSPMYSSARRTPSRSAGSS